MAAPTHTELPGVPGTHEPSFGRSIGSLRRYAKRSAGRKAPGEPGRCELCSLPLAESHRHLLETRERRVVCSCDACALRFADVVGGRFKLIPRDVSELSGFQIDDALWESLALPIDLVFLFRSTPADRMVALYPGPAGATESLLPLETWSLLVERNPELAGLQADVEALLVNRTGDARRYFIAPMDRCYALVGLLRLHWRGLSGGDRVWSEIAAFFDQLGAKSRPRIREERSA